MQKKSFSILLLLFTIVLLLPKASECQFLRKKIKQMFVKKVDQQALKQPVASVFVTLRHDGRERSYYLYKPTSWDGKTSIPLVFLFHGGGGGGRGALYYYELEKKAEEAGFLLVAPNGTGETENVLLTWNVGFGFGYAQKNKVDDIGFINALIDDLARIYPIDPKRIYATGLSNGAIFCHFLAAQPGNRIAAIAPVVGTAGGRDKGEKKWTMPPDPKTPVSVCILQGLVDQRVPISGGLQLNSTAAPKEMLSASATIDFWLKANGSANVASSSYIPGLNATLHEFGAGRNGTEVKAYIIHDMGHAWPGSTRVPRWGSDKPPTSFPGNDIIWEFFKNHPRP